MFAVSYNIKFTIQIYLFKKGVDFKKEQRWWHNGHIGGGSAGWLGFPPVLAWKEPGHYRPSIALQVVCLSSDVSLPVCWKQSHRFKVAQVVF